MKSLTAEEIATLRLSVAGWEEIHQPGPWGDVARLLDEVERSRALLRRVEWNGEFNDCPACGGTRPDHESGCELAALGGDSDDVERERALAERVREWCEVELADDPMQETINDLYEMAGGSRRDR